MKQPPSEPLAQAPATPATRSTRSTTVLNHVAPTVVRRRVVEVPVSVRVNSYAAADEDDESGPPSSVNVARALASLRGHELERLEEILDAGDEDDEAEAQRAASSSPRSERSAPSPPSLPRVPTVKVGPTIALTLLAQRLGVDDQELVTALVTHGFFSITVKATLPRETARAAATLFGYQIEETDEVEAAPPKAKAKAKPAAPAPSAKSGAKSSATTTTTTSKGGNAVTRRTSKRA